jgi:hypothetical protein
MVRCPNARVHDVQGVVVDVFRFSSIFVMTRSERCTFHRLAGALAPRDHGYPGRHRMRFQVLSGDPVLTFPSLAEDERDPIRGRSGLDPAGKPSRHP